MDEKYLESSNERIVLDYISGMTDDYFIDAFAYLFPNNALREKIQYVEYFDKRFIK